MRKNSEPTHIGTFASHLFGIEKQNDDAPQKNVVESRDNEWLLYLANFQLNTPNTKPVKEPNKSGNFTQNLPFQNEPKPVKRTVFNGKLSENPIKAVLPYIDAPAFSATMDNYRIYVAQYNEKARVFNELILSENKEIDKIAASGQLTEVQTTFRDLFIKKNKGLHAEDYNKLADEFNQERGLLVKKKPIQTVKYASELVFQQILYMYSCQLAAYSNEYMKFNVNEPQTLRKIELNAHTITTLTRNGELSIDVCKQTIRNHRAKLQKCGVLVDYQFRGNKKGIKMHVNSQILTVLDAKTSIYTGAENQRIIPETFKVFKDNKENTRTFKNNIKKRENGQADLSNLGTPAAVFSHLFLQEHNTQETKGQTTGAAENVKVLENNIKISSDNLEKTILHPMELAQRLSNGDFNNYTPIDIRFLHREAMYGTLTREEFNAIIVQDFFKTAAKYYKNHTVYVGSWKKAIESWTSERFTRNNGNGIHLYNKQLMVDLLSEYRWRLKNSERFYLKSKINRLFPSDYFDFTRKTKQEIGFEYTATAYKRHQEYLKREPELKKRAKNKAAKRVINNSYAKKYDLILQRFFKNRITFEQLYDYVKDNLPVNFMEKLSEVTTKTASKYTC
jgi:hypothetical protein